MLTIREVIEADIPVLLDLIKKLAAYEKKKPEEVGLTEDKIKRHCFGDSKYFNALLVECDNQPIGYALYFYTYSGYVGAPVLFLEDLYIEDAFRNRGFGRMVLQKLATMALEKNCCRMEWRCFSWNEKAIEFYKKLGAEFKPEMLLIRLQQQYLKELI